MAGPDTRSVFRGYHFIDLSNPNAGLEYYSTNHRGERNDIIYLVGSRPGRIAGSRLDEVIVPEDEPLALAIQCSFPPGGTGDYPCPHANWREPPRGVLGPSEDGEMYDDREAAMRTREKRLRLEFDQAMTKAISIANSWPKGKLRGFMYVV